MLMQKLIDLILLLDSTIDHIVPRRPSGSAVDPGTNAHRITPLVAIQPDHTASEVQASLASQHSPFSQSYRPF